MLRSLRWQLTLLYLLASIGLVGLVGGGTFALIDRYFQHTTDLALEFTMATEFRQLGLDLPRQLARSEALWLQDEGRSLTSPEPTPFPSISNESDEHEESEEAEHKSSINQAESHTEEDRRYDASLAAIFVLSMDESGYAILAPNQPQPPIVDDPDIKNTAMQSGFDLRTVFLPGEGRVRILTYPTGLTVPAFIQTGRLLSDQDRLLDQYLLSLAIFGSAATGVLALVSWWLAGRSLGPMQKAWDQQQNFVANASHELRTPLTLIRAIADSSLRNHPGTEQSKKYSDILNECDYMDQLVDDLLLLSRLDARRLKLAPEAVSISALFNEIVRQVGNLASAGGVTISQNAPAVHVNADRTRLRQVLLILLDNALRFTPKGGSIHLTAKQARNEIQIEVADSGQGIAPEHLPHVFDRFYQAGPPVNESNRSNGLGLSIAKSLIEAQGGSIHISSEAGRGTRVLVLLPAG